MTLSLNCPLITTSWYFSTGDGTGTLRLSWDISTGYMFLYLEIKVRWRLGQMKDHFCRWLRSLCSSSQSSRHIIQVETGLGTGLVQYVKETWNQINGYFSFSNRFTIVFNEGRDYVNQRLLTKGSGKFWIRI